MIFRRVVRWIAVLVLCLFLAGVLGWVLTWWSLRASLARLNGEVVVPGIGAPVRVDRDALGVPTIDATNRVDAAFALGFLHGQERFFQMDLLRRSGAGELAELLGKDLVVHDVELRRHQFRGGATIAVERLRPAHREIVDAYTAGVNAGLERLSVRPPEYLLLRVKPVPWRAEDCFLVACAMFLTLQDSTGEHDLNRELVRRVLPQAAADFYFPPGSEWDAPLDRSSLVGGTMPSAEVLDVSRDPWVAAAVELWDPGVMAGSNAWGVEGAAGKGAAVIANDMHLDLGLPNTWFRARLRWHRADGERMDLTGVTLPGVPVVVVGSNGHIAWSLTNANLDTTDVVVLETDPVDPGRYRTPEGWMPFEIVQERIPVRAGEDHVLTYERTIWGPVLKGREGEPRQALAWLPHRAEVLDFDILELEEARSVAEALEIAPKCGAVPVQNFLVGDRSGALAWTLIGKLPKREGFDGRVPVAWGGGRQGWKGWVEASHYPRHVAQPGERLWTANNRILGTPEYLTLGPWEADIGARAGRIRERLQDLSAPVQEKDLFDIFRDDTAVLLQRWHQLLTRTLREVPAGTNAARWAELASHVENWGARAATNSVGFRMVRGFRIKVFERVMAPIVARCRELDPDARIMTDHNEEAVWTIVGQRPRHLLHSRFASYEALLADAVNAVLHDLEALSLPLDRATWGEHNTVRIQHPISLAIPALSRWLDVPPVPLPGDRHTPRVQGVRMGASERLVVSPGHEDRGLFHMPGGQSGHFLSPFYRAGHDAWVEVATTPFLPGPARHTLFLRP